MNIYEFINSKDVRNHLKEINYEFNPVEAAWVVWRCHNRVLEEKHKAWQEIIDTMPNVQFEVPHINKNKKLHEFLKEIIAIDNKLLNEFYNNVESAVYSYYILFHESPYTYYGKKEYAKYDDMLKDLKRYIKNCETKIFRVIVNKEYKNKSVLEMDLNINLEVKDIGGYYGDRDEIFDILWFPIPTPFKQGDIVWFSNGIDREPYVITFEEKTISKSTRVDNLSVYRQVPDSCGEIELRSIHRYLDLEYYHGELDGDNKIIRVLSNYLKGKIDTALFANAYHHYLTESYFKRTKEIIGQMKI